MGVERQVHAACRYDSHHRFFVLGSRPGREGWLALYVTNPESCGYAASDERVYLCWNWDEVSLLRTWE